MQRALLLKESPAAHITNYKSLKRSESAGVNKITILSKSKTIYPSLTIFLSTFF